MAGQIRFYTDENVSRAVIDRLRSRGVDVASAPEMGMLARSDDEHLELAAGLGRTLLTHDDDFLRLDGQGIPHAGIAYTHQIPRSQGFSMASCGFTRPRPLKT